MRVITLLCFALAPVSLPAAFNWNDNCRQAYASIMDLRFADAKDMIAKEKKADPSNNIVHLLDNYIDLLTLVIGEEKNEFYLRQSSKRKRLSSIESDKTEKSPWKDFCRAEIELQWAFSRLKFGENLTAAKEISRAYHILEDLQKNFPGFLPAKKSMGLLHCLIGSVPDKYSWLTDLKGLKGSVVQGKTELTEVMNASTGEYAWLKEETTFYLSFVLQNLDNDEESSGQILDEFIRLRPFGVLTIYAASSIALKNGQNQVALKMLEGYHMSADAFPFHYLEYLRGLCLLHNLDTACRTHFLKYLSAFKGQTFIKAAFQKLAWSYLVFNDTASYRKYMKQAGASGTTLTDEDKMAAKEYLDPLPPHPALIKSRLLFDGGDYAGALKILTAQAPSSVFSTIRDLAESGYRMGRIYHKLDKRKEACGIYELVVKDYGGKPWYFAASAALNLGLIYEKSGDKEKAGAWFRKCLAIKGHEYKESIDQKAKAGLNRLEAAN